MEAQCTAGIRSESKCNLKTYSKTVGVESVFEIELDTTEIMLWRSGLIILNNAIICCHHKYILLNCYATQQKTCCNAFGLHKSVCRGRIRIIFSMLNPLIPSVH